MAIFYTSFKKRKRNRLPQTDSLKKAILEQRKYLKSLGVDPDRRIDKSQFRAYGNWWEVNYNTDNTQQKQSVTFSYRYWKNLTDEADLPKPLQDRIANILVNTVERRLLSNLPKVFNI